MQMYLSPKGIFQAPSHLSDRTFSSAMGSFQGFLLSALACLALVSLARSSEPQLPLPYASNSYDAVPEASQSHNLHELSSVPGSYVQNYDVGPQGYKVQSGFEGYLIPHGHDLHGLSTVKEGVISHLVSFLAPIIHTGVAILPKIGIVLVGVIALVVVGTLVSSCVCAFTPICHIKFLGVNLNKESFRGFITQDRLSELAHFVQAAVKKYQEMNKTAEPAPVNGNEIN